MTTSSVDVVRALSPAMGVEVEIGPRVDLSEPAQEELRRLFDEHHVLLLRDLPLDYEAQSALVGALGPVVATRRTSVMSNVLPTPEGVIIGQIERLWHSDWAFTREPCPGVSLHAVDVGYETTSTRFANGVRAYEVLPMALQEELRSLQVVHFNAPAKAVGSLPPSGQRFIHPLIFTHPRTGARVLYAPMASAAEIVGLDPNESARILEDAMARTYAEDNVYEHWWRVGDTLIWDNVALQHARSAASTTEARTLQRVLLAEHDLSELVGDYSPRKYLPQHAHLAR